MEKGERGMNSDEFEAAFNDAVRIMRNAESCAAHAVRFATGRLRRLHPGETVLRELKRELRNFNSRTGKWKI